MADGTRHFRDGVGVGEDMRQVVTGAPDQGTKSLEFSSLFLPALSSGLSMQWLRYNLANVNPGQLQREQRAGMRLHGKRGRKKQKGWRPALHHLCPWGSTSSNGARQTYSAHVNLSIEHLLRPKWWARC